MAKINLLPSHEARKIAAGEVVERPSHIIKELVENALDAGATSITLYLEEAGKKLIRLVDNGSGMDEQDARICFQPHATSKITQLDDLETIATFGFRGEALASIAAVSNVTLVTKLAGSDEQSLATRVTYTEDRLLDQQAVAGHVGTDISIHELFYNTPARKKFLKQDETEWNVVQQTMYAFCLSNLSVSFKIFHNNKMMLNAPAVATLKDRAAQVWGTDIAANLIPCAGDDRFFAVSGCISHHQFWRYGKTHLFFFVNNRWVKNSEFGKALLKGYLNVLPRDRFPAGIIFITVDPREIDVNIHPKKEEVKVSKPGVLTSLITQCVRETLDARVDKLAGDSSNVVQNKLRTEQFSALSDKFDSGHAIPLKSFETPVFASATTRLLRTSGGQEQFAGNLSDYMTSLTHVGTQPPLILSLSKGMSEQAVLLQNPLTLSPSQDGVVGSKGMSATKQVPATTILGQLFNTYILVQKEHELIMVDQHAAHERVLYEKYTEYFDASHGTLLLFPEVVTLTKELVDAILPWQDFFEKQGIQFDALGSRELAVRSAPPQLRGPSLRDLITDAAHFVLEHGTLDRTLLSTRFNEHMHSHMACKAAVKAGDVLTQEQMRQLLDDLLLVSNRFICVHGRPTMWTLSQQDIEKHFRR